MSAITFPATVANGQLRFDVSLEDLEGARVLVTLEPCTEPDNGGTQSEQQQLDEMDVERDVVLHTPFRWEPIQGSQVDGDAIRPTMILPEALPDE